MARCLKGKSFIFCCHDVIFPQVTYCIIYTFLAYNFVQIQFQVHVKQAIVTAENSLYETGFEEKEGREES